MFLYLYITLHTSISHIIMKSLYLSLIFCFCFGFVKAQTTRYVIAVGGIDAAPCSLGSPCATIQFAINTAVANDVISVAAGTYAGAVNINKSVSIVGPNANTLSSVLPAARLPEANITGVFTLSANNVTINGLQFTAGGRIAGEGNNFTFRSNYQITTTASTTLISKTTLTPNTTWEISNNRCVSVGLTGINTDVRYITGLNYFNNVIQRHNSGLVMNFVTTANVDCNIMGGSAATAISQNAFVVGESCATISILNNTFARCTNSAVFIYAGLGTDFTLGIAGTLLIRNNTFNTVTVRIRAQNIAFAHSFISIVQNYFSGNLSGDMVTTGLTIPTGIIDAAANRWSAGTPALSVLAAPLIASVRAYVWLDGGNVDADLATCGYQPVRKVIFTLGETPILQNAVDAVPIPSDTNYWELLLDFSISAYTTCVNITRPLILDGAGSIIRPATACNQAILISSNDIIIKNLIIDVNGTVVPAAIYANGRTRLSFQRITCNLAIPSTINFIHPEGLTTSSVAIAAFGTGIETIDIKGCTILSANTIQFQRGIWIKNMITTIGGALPVDGNTISADAQSILLENIKTLTLVQNNTINSFNNGGALYLGGCTNANILNNAFATNSLAINYNHIRVNSGWLSTQVAPYQSIILNIKGNTFTSLAANTGTGIQLLNSNKGGATPDYSIVNIGGTLPGEANTFSDGFTKFIKLSSVPTREYSDDVQTAFNNYDVGTGSKNPATMVLAELFTLEDRIDHKPDAGTSGFVRVVPNNTYITVNSFDTPTTTTAFVQRAVDATAQGDFVNINTGTYAGITTITKDITFNPSPIGTIALNTLVMNGVGEILTVTENLTITTGLTLTNGIIKNPNKIIILPNSFTTLVQGNGFVTGGVEILKTSIGIYNFIFPVGDETNGYKPFRINAINGSNFDIVVNTNLAAPIGTGTPQPISCLLNRYWTVLYKNVNLNTPINFTYTTNYALSDGIDAPREPLAVLGLSSTDLNTSYVPISTPPPSGGIINSGLQINSIANNSTLYVRLGVNYPAPVFTIVGAASVCEGGSISLTINNPQAGATYTWTGVSFTATGTTVSVPSSAIGIAGVTGNINVTAQDVGGCPSQPAAKSITVIAQPVATFSYSSASVCKSAGTANPTVTLDSGSNFTATPSGLSINASTGVIDLTTSTSATYTITHDIPAANGCTAVSATFSLTISELPISATITSPITTICTSQTVVLTCTTTGAGLIYQWKNGATNVGTNSTTFSATTAGSYTVEISNAICTTPIVSNAIVMTTVTQPVATFSYSSASVCKSAGTANPTVTLDSGSNFTATPSGLSINASTGVIDLTTSTSATYTITHDIPAANGCTAVSATFSLTISELPISATITSPITTICTSQTVVLTCTTTGAGLIYQWKNGATNVGTNSTTFSATTAGSYTVEISNAICTTPIVSNAIVMTTVTQPVATFSYSSASVCKSAGTANPTVTLDSGSNFTATPSGLSINASTGVIDLTTSTSATYTITHDIPAANGCTAVSATFSLTISELPISATITSPITTICTSQTVVLTCTTTGAGLIYQWKNGATNVGTNSTTFSATTAGSYTVEISNAICTTPIVSNAIVMTTVTQPVATFSYSSASFCKTGTTTPTITDMGGVFTVVSQTAGISNTGLIINASTGEIDLATSQVDATTRTATYQITYTIAAANGCNSATTNTVISIAEPSLPAISASTLSICTSSSATLTATTRADYSNYKWTLLPAAVIANSATSTFISVSVGGTYELEITNPCGTQTINVVITAVTQPVATITYPKTKYCSSEVGNISPTATINANSVFSVAPAGLTINATTGVITIDANTQADANFERIYTITHNIPAGTSNCNPVSATFAITIYKLPVARITNPSPYFYCSGTIKLEAEIRSDYQYQWKNNGIDVAGATSAALSTTTVGNYTVVVASGGVGGCSVVSNIVVIQQGTNPVVSITPTLVGVQGQTVPLAPVITAPTGQEKYEWLPNDGSFSDNTTLNPVFTFTNSGTYTLTVRVGEGCVGTTSFTTTVNADVYLPSAFFPESSTLENQTFKIYGFGISELEFKVYDRLGKLVYQTTDIATAQNIGWDGKYNGQNLPNGAYIWYLSGKKINGDELKINGKTAGTVMLMK